MKSFCSMSSLTVLGFLAVSAVVYAAPITYTFNADVTGSLAGTPFTNAALTMTVAGDSTNVTNGTAYGPLVFLNDIGTASTTFSVGSSSGALTDDIEIWNCQNVLVCDGGPDVIELIAFNQEIDVFNSAFSTYDLTTAIGPVASADPQLFLPVDLNTTQGALDITDLENLTFQASLASVPEPGTFLLVSTVFLVAWGVKRKHSGRRR